MSKGIILAGGNGTRLYPVTKAVCKHLLPVYDKPMIYYPLSVYMLAGIREVLVIVKPFDKPLFERLLGDGSQWGIQISYEIQEKPNGIAEAFLIGEEFIGKDPCALILGDNILYKDALQASLKTAVRHREGSTIFAYQVQDPERYGVVDFDENDMPVKLTEKPRQRTSNWAVIGLYFYDNRVVEFAKKLRPSARGELEITDLNNMYLADRTLRVEKLGRGAAWLDMGTFDSMLDASQFVQVIEKRQGSKIADLDEIARNLKYIK